MLKRAFQAFLRKRLSCEARTRLRQRRLQFRMKTRQRFAFLYRKRYGTFDSADLERELRRRIGEHFEILMVHCSFNDLWPMYTDSAQNLLKALIRICQPDKTLAMPAFFLRNHGLPADQLYRKDQVFHVRKTVSHMGLLSELFRHYKGVKRSLHPTESVCALGPLAEELTARHHLCPTTFGEGTPFAMMASKQTKILGIGTTYVQCLTQVHTAEDLLRDRYPVQKTERAPCLLIDGKGEEHQYMLSMYPSGIYDIAQRIEVIRGFLGKDELVEWRFHGTPMFHTTAKRVTEAACAAAERGIIIY